MSSDDHLSGEASCPSRSNRRPPSGAIANLDTSHPLLVAATFLDTHAGVAGGAVANLQHSDPRVTDSVFRVNGADLDDAGGIITSNSTARIDFVRFIDNDGDGGAIINDGSVITLTHALFSGNSASCGGTALANRNSTVTASQIVINDHMRRLPRA